MCTKKWFSGKVRVAVAKYMWVCMLNITSKRLQLTRSSSRFWSEFPLLRKEAAFMLNSAHWLCVPTGENSSFLVVQRCFADHLRGCRFFYACLWPLIIVGCHFTRLASKCSRIVLVEPARLWEKGSRGDCSTTEGSTMRAKHVPSISRRAPSVGTIMTMPRDKERVSGIARFWARNLVFFRSHGCWGP